MKPLKTLLAATLFALVAATLFTPRVHAAATNVTFTITIVDPAVGGPGQATGFAIFQNTTNVANIAASGTGTNTWTTPPFPSTQQFVWGVQGINLVGSGPTATIANPVSLQPPVLPSAPILSIK